MSTTASLNKATTSSAAASTVSSTTGGAPTTVVQGEQAPSVVVQSQLATSTVDGKGVTRSNLNQIVGDLGAAHQAHSGWLESEMAKVSEWGNTEIQRLMVQTKGVEERLVAEAQQQQKLLEESHKGDLARLVQELDAKKAMRLKELEDGLQRQIQAALNTSKKDINNIESEMNKRKMALMTQAQLQTAKDVDRLSNLSVEARLVPSTTRTIIETNTSTGTVVAVAGGGEISTGQASAQSIRTENIVAAPTAGTLTQTTDVKTGDIRRNDNDAKVGSGAIVSTLTDVSQRPAVTQPITGTTTGASTLGHTATTGASTLGQTSTVRSTESLESGRAHTDAPLPIGHQTGGNITTTATTGAHKHIDAAYGRDIKPAHDATFDKTHHATEHKHKEGLLSKVKHAITGEPKSSQAHNTRV